MGWSFRKSVKIGHIRINLSKSGLGASTGFDGANVSTGPRGTFASLSRYGLRYSKRIARPIIGFSRKRLSHFAKSVKLKSHPTSIQQPIINQAKKPTNSLFHRMLNLIFFNSKIKSASNPQLASFTENELIVFRDKIIAQINSKECDFFDYYEIAKINGIQTAIAKDIAENILLSYVKHAITDKQITVQENDKIKQITTLLQIEEQIVQTIVQKGFTELFNEKS